MRKLRLAILFDSHLPTHGGSFSLINSIVEGFRQTNENDEFKIKIFLQVNIFLPKIEFLSLSAKDLVLIACALERIGNRDRN